jgi:thioredoxin 1
MMILKTRLFIIALALSLCLPLALSCQQATPPSAPDLASIPLEQALSSGLPTLAEFGRGVCVPCKAMKPILEELATEYEGKLNVVIVEIDNHMDQTMQYEIMVIPTQIFFDSTGKEITRHIGFWPKEEIIAQLEKMGIE